MSDPQGNFLRRAALLVLTAALVMVPLAARAQTVKHVLVLTADSPQLPGNRVLLDALQSVLRAEFPARVEFYLETIDLRQVANDPYERLFADLMSERFRGVQLDLVVALTQPAIEFVLREHDRLFARSPLLLGFIDRRVLDQRAVPAKTGVVFLQPEAAATVRLAIATNPATRRVLVVGGTSRFDRGWLQGVREDLGTRTAGVSIEYDTESSLQALLDRVAALPADSVVLFTSATRDGVNAPVRSIEVLERMRAVARVPIYGLSNTYLGKGIVGGTLLDFDRHGQELSQQALRLLRGEATTPGTTAGVTAVDWRELQRFGLSAATLPPSTVIAFRQPGFWQRYRLAIVSVTLVVGAQAALIVTLASLIRRRREAQRLLEDRLRFQRRLSELSLSLTAVPYESLEAAVDAALSDAADALGADWLWRWEPGAAEDEGWELPVGAADAPVTFASCAQLPATIRRRLQAVGADTASAVVMPLPHTGVPFGALFWLARTAGCAGRARPDELKIVATIVGNVLQRRTAEAAVGHSDRLKGAILDSLPALVSVLDREGRIIAVNDAWIAHGRKAGVSSGSSLAPGGNYLDRCRAAARDGEVGAAEALTIIDRACSGQRSDHQVECVSMNAADPRWFLMSAEPLRRTEGGAVVTFLDITQRKLSEMALRESEDRFRRLADGLPVAIWMSEPDGRASYFNRQWLEMTGRRLEDEIGDGWLKGVHPDDRDACSRASLRDRQHPRRFSVDYRLRQADGRYRWLMDVGMPRYGADGSFHGYVGGCIDITERREIESMLRDLSLRLILAREDERRYIARELHDHLNQQLALLAIDLQQLAARLPDSTEALVAALEAAWQRTADIASDVHGISHRLHPSKLEALGLVATIRAHCRDVSRQSLAVHFADEGAGAAIPSDVSLCLFRVAEEALTNVVRHSAAPEVHVSLVDTPEDIQLRVSDSGRGFSKPPAASPGIGLVSMRERLHALGGTLTITSSPGQGTVVEARIPRSRTPQPADAWTPV